MDIHRRCQGFTLVEIVGVIIVVAILAIYPLIKWPGTIINLDGQAENLASDIRYAQSLAMTRGVRYQFIKTSSTSYQVTTSSGTPILLGNGDTTATLDTGITFGTLTNIPNDLIAFDGQGIPYINNNPTPTALSSTASIPLSGGGNTKTVIIRPETGSVDVQ